MTSKNANLGRKCIMGYLACLILTLSTIQYVEAKGDSRRTGVGGCYCPCTGCHKENEGPVKRFVDKVKIWMFGFQGF